MFKNHVEVVAVFGKIYTNLISALVIPLLFVSIISSISSLESISKLKTIGVKSIFWLIANTFTASVLTLVIAGGLKTGKTINFTLPTDYEAREVPKFLDTIVGLFPKNIVSHAANGEVVPFIIFAVIMGIALVYFQGNDKEAAAPFKTFIDSANKLMFVIVEFVIDLTPFAVLSLIANAVSTYGVAELVPLLSVLVLAYVLCAIQMFVIDGALIGIVGRLNPIKFFKGFWPAQVVAFTSQSSVGTIPVTVKQLVSRLGVNEDIASFTAALGANLGMPACAGIWPMLLAILAINIFDIQYTAVQYIFLVALTLVVSIGTVGVPGTSTITTTAIFTAAGLPVEIIVLLVPISSVVDMMRTAANVTGAATAAVLVAKSEKLIDTDIYNRKDSEDNVIGNTAVFQK
ncbi:MAG: dicarboxylate/amino acid:cation symporter [Lachnospiraceae bacterium]|nr:dicarboxylate/amino acid:cation symporter [Lachnospiraceae bacterium]